MSATTSEIEPAARGAAFSLSLPLAAAMAKRDLYYGWIVVGATFLVMLTTAGVAGATGVFIAPLEKEFGWTAEQISVAFALRIALFGLMGPFAAAFINRFGVRAVVAAAELTIACGVLGSLFMTQAWQLVALWGVV
ncbi:MAG: MFS transporter, partial [Hyphomicrobiales bacterium]|nr:MFS transporter [Hyphomicrobiales bacterium]